MKMNKAIALLGAFSCLMLPAAGMARGGGHSGFGHVSSHSSTSEHIVSGYTTKRGTYVAPHYATNPNSTRNDNYSTRGNINPHTGEEGTKPRDEDVTAH
jgi:hypothetical protein